MTDLIQDSLLAVTAILVWRYVKSTQELVTIAQDQADKTRVLAEAAPRQTEAAERNLALLESQIQDREGAATDRLKENIAELRQVARHWIERMASWGDVPRQTRLSLLPDGRPYPQTTEANCRPNCTVILSRSRGLPMTAGGPAYASPFPLEGAPSKLRLDGGFLRLLHRRNDSETLPRSRGPLRLDFDGTRRARRIVAKAAPGPILGGRH
jgi:hypothetical protein